MTRRFPIRVAMAAAIAALGVAPGAAASPAAGAGFGDRVYFGGHLGLSFGAVDYVEVSPYVGVILGHDVSGGVGVFYRHREDGRYEPDLSTSDYGYSLFVRYRPLPEFFLQGEYSWTDFEYLLLDGSTVREDYTALLIGGGFVQPLGGRTAFIVSALYDVNWSADDLTPYDSPWIVGAGVSVGF